MHFGCKFSRLNYTCILNVSFIPALGEEKRNDVPLPQTCQQGLWRPDAVIYCFQPATRMSSAETTLSEDSSLVSSSEREESLTVIGGDVIVSVDLFFFSSSLNPRQEDPVSSPVLGRHRTDGNTSTGASAELMVNAAVSWRANAERCPHSAAAAADFRKLCERPNVDISCLEFHICNVTPLIYS